MKNKIFNNKKLYKIKSLIFLIYKNYKKFKKINKLKQKINFKCKTNQVKYNKKK